jgi:hypothetical protein
MNLTAKLLFEQIRLPMGSKWPLSGKLRHSIATLDQWPLRAGSDRLLHHAHFDMKGGNRTFAALCTEVCNADKKVTHK